MKIAIIGWGSLIWDPQDLPREGAWQRGGPKLPIEFSRISQDGRLTLVIDESHGILVPTRYVLSPRTNLEDAIADLLVRERTTKKGIGFVDLKHNNLKTQGCSTKIGEIIRAWTKKTGFDSAIWTALEPNFKTEIRDDFSIKRATEYLSNLPKTAKTHALNYFQNAPEEVLTPLRKALLKENIIES